MVIKGESPLEIVLLSPPLPTYDVTHVPVVVTALNQYVPEDNDFCAANVAVRSGAPVESVHPVFTMDVIAIVVSATIVPKVLLESL